MNCEQYLLLRRTYLLDVVKGSLGRGISAMSASEADLLTAMLGGGCIRVLGFVFWY